MYTMIYRGYTKEIPLPNRNFGLYSVYSLTLPLERNDAAPRRSASSRMTRGAYETHLHANMDLAPKEAATWAIPVGNNGELPECFTLQQVNIPPGANKLLKDQKVDGRRPQVVNGK